MAKSPIKRWKWMAPLGLILTGAGFSIAAEAAIWKSQGVEWTIWVSMGTVGLILFNGGLVTFGEAVKLSTLDAWKNSKK